MRPRRLAALIIGLPMILAIGYYTVFAADRYVSETIVTVRDSGSHGGGAASGLALLVPGVNPPARQETLYLMKYVYSMDMLKYLDGKLGLRQAYAAAPHDVFFRLFSWTSQEWFLRYFRDRVNVSFDDASSLLTIGVEAFDPAAAHAIATAILAESERFVNDISQRMAREQMAFAESELDKAREWYQAAKARQIEFQSRHNLLDPVADAQAAVSLSGALEAELARLEADLKNLLTFLKDNAHEVVSLRNKIGALREQIESERSRSVSEDGNRLNALAAEFQNITLEMGFAQDAYKAALSTVESARMEASRKVKSLVIVQSPTLPEVAIYPRRIYNLITIAVTLTLLYGIARLGVATVRDHQD